MTRWYLIVAALGFLAGTLVWEARGDYRPLDRTPRSKLGALLPAAELRGFIVVVPLDGLGRCTIVDDQGRTIARFVCDASSR